MRFEELSPDNAAELEAWFINPVPENRFIEFYKDTAKWMELTESSDRRLGCIVYKDNEMVGFADIEIEDDTASISIGIKPELRGQGLGKELMRAILDLPILQNLHKVMGGVEKDNIASKRLLHSFGFIQSGGDEEVIEFTKLM